MEKEMADKQTIVDMTSDDLAEYIKEIDFKHRLRLRALRAYLKVLQAEELAAIKTIA